MNRASSARVSCQSDRSIPLNGLIGLGVAQSRPMSCNPIGAFAFGRCPSHLPKKGLSLEIPEVMMGKNCLRMEPTQRNAERREMGMLS